VSESGEGIRDFSGHNVRSKSGTNPVPPPPTPIQSITNVSPRMHLSTPYIGMGPVGQCRHPIGWLCSVRQWRFPNGYTTEKLPVLRRQTRRRSQDPACLIQTKLESVTTRNRHCCTEYDEPIGWRRLTTGSIPM
jgi:hypothetical protein